ncbi:MAG TPA: MotA/TolQ/ExbB proton channel family protein [Fibrobacteria bacterium]|nr:MotA/TolQ/ExbB proton channel family protein [Fibrobacteria bacterium]
MHGLAEFYLAGGALMFVTLAVGLVGIAIVVDRAWRYFGDYSMDTKVFMKKVRALLVEDRVDDALRLCANQKKGLVPAVVKAAVERYGCDEALVKQNVEAAYLTVVPKIAVRLGYLSLIANVAVLMGLVGTVWGMISMFKGLGNVDAATKQTVMASGISHALHNTFQGLFIAVICMMFHSWLSAKAAHLIEEIDHASSEALDWVNLKAFGKLHENAK